MRRSWVTLTGVGMIAAGLIWAAVAWASMSVQVDGLKGTQTVDINPENSDIKDVIYNLPNGRTRITGWSLPKVLSNADIGAEGWTRIFVGDIEVRLAEIENEEFSGNRLPVFAIERNGEGDDVFFIRPKKGDNPAQIDKNNNLRMNYRVPIKVTPPLDKPETGETIKFRANAPGPDSQYDFEWNASGQTGTGTTFEYTFPSSPGRVQINVEGTRSGQVQAEATIGTPVKAPPPSPNSGSSGPSYTSPSYSSPSYGTPPSSDFDYDYDFPGSGSNTEIPESTPKVPDTEETPPLEDLGTDVEGELLSAIAPLPPESGDALPPGEELPPDPEAAIEEAEEINAPGALIAGGIVVGLLGLGAGREMENVRPRRLRRPDLSRLRRLSPPWK
jgi:hypothetical protein